MGLSHALSGDAFASGFASKTAARTIMTRDDWRCALDEINAAARREMPAWRTLVPVTVTAAGVFAASQGAAVAFFARGAIYASMASQTVYTGLLLALVGAVGFLHSQARLPHAVRRLRQHADGFRERLRPLGVDWELLERSECDRRYPLSKDKDRTGGLRRGFGGDGFVLVVRRLQSSLCGTGCQIGGGGGGSDRKSAGHPVSPSRPAAAGALARGHRRRRDRTLATFV